MHPDVLMIVFSFQALSRVQGLVFLCDDWTSDGGNTEMLRDSVKLQGKHIITVGCFGLSPGYKYRDGNVVAAKKSKRQPVSHTRNTQLYSNLAARNEIYVLNSIS